MAGDVEVEADGPTQILVGVDGSTTSMRALVYAVGLARRQGAQIVAAYVASTRTVAVAVPAAAGAMVRTQAQIATELQATIDAIETETGVHITWIERTGSPYRELVRVADDLRVDAVVVGASTQAEHRLIGSLASRLVKYARWPVTVVP